MYNNYLMLHIFIHLFSSTSCPFQYLGISNQITNTFHLLCHIREYYVLTYVYLIK